MARRNTIPLDAFFDETGTEPNWSGGHLKALDEVDVIIGVDTITEHEFIMFGREIIRQKADGQDVRADVMFIEINEQKDDLERLAALVEAVKGHHEYESFGER